MELLSIKGLPLPALLLRLLESGAWRHPGDVVIARAIPFLQETVDFLTSIEVMRRESGMQFADDPAYAYFHLVRGATRPTPVELPWLDVELSVLVAVNRELGADIGVAFDYRTSRSDPRVVVSDWWSVPLQCYWREAAPTFSAFVVELGLG